VWRHGISACTLAHSIDGQQLPAGVALGSHDLLPENGDKTLKMGKLCT